MIRGLNEGGGAYLLHYGSFGENERMRNREIRVNAKRIKDPFDSEQSAVCLDSIRHPSPWGNHYREMTCKVRHKASESNQREDDSTDHFTF